MKKRNAVVPLFLLMLVFIAFLIRRWNEPRRKEAFDRHPSLLVYTARARCSMNCRHISRNDIVEIMKKGIINFYKSSRNARPCPIFALQGQTAAGKSMQVMFAQCASQTLVLTCYNLRDSFTCHCPGNESKTSY